MHRSLGLTPTLFLVAAICAATASCRSGEEVDNNTNNETNTIIPPLPETEPLLDRAGLLDAIRNAASAFAAGVEDGELQTALDGRRFSIRIPFGCSIDEGENDPKMQMRLKVRGDGRSYQVNARPVIDAETAGFTESETEGSDKPADSKSAYVESVEGFWFHRPWILADRCPAIGKDTDPEARALALKPNAPDDKSSETADDEVTHTTESHWPHRIAGIARFVTNEDSRVGNRGSRDYSKVVTLKENEQPPEGLFLVLEGRLRAWPGGKVVRCLEQGPDKPPQCLAGASIDRVAIERIDDKSVVAEWIK